MNIKRNLLKLSAELGALDVLDHTVSMCVEFGHRLPEAVHHLLPSGLRGISLEQATSLAAYKGCEEIVNSIPH